MKPRTARGKRALARLALPGVSLLFTAIAVEMLVLPLLIRTAPLKLQGDFTHTMQILAQTSKRGMLPENYILLLGDSYARGHGDWLASADMSASPPYHSAHVIHERMDRDVLSFGVGGAGSIRGMVTIPAMQFRLLARRGLLPPQTVLVYFYEGNDLWNNLRYLRDHYDDRYDRNRVLEADAFDAFLQEEIDRTAGTPKMSDGILTYAYIQKLWKRRSRQEIEPAIQGEINRAFIDGEITAIPDQAQSPVLEFEDEDFRIALHVADRSVWRLKRIFPAANVHIVYIPAPLSIYEIASERVSVQTYLGRDSVYPAGRVSEWSDRIREAVREMARLNEVGFLDPTDDLRRAARRRAIHGPRDWLHFNEEGYRILGRAVSNYLGASPSADNAALSQVD